jgi:6-phosphogluconolactonase
LNIWAPQAPSTIVFIGTYSGDGTTDSKGIYAFELDEVKSTLIPLGLSVETTNASYVLIHPSRQYLYAVNEQDEGTVTAFRIDPAQRGRLHLINHQSSRGSGPCHISTNRFGEYLFVANYNNGTVAVLPIDVNNGSLRHSSSFDQQTGSSIDPVRQASAHAHCILLDRREEYALSADLGSDQIYHYRFNPSNGSIERTEITKAGRPGDGPRHLIFNFNERFVYVINELKSEITVFRYFPTMEPIQSISTLPENYTLPNTAAEVLLHPITGRQLYASNRGHNSIAVFNVDFETGTLSLIQHISVQGQTPRDFNISPNGKFLIVANQDSHNIVLFTIDEQTGRLTSTGSSAQISSPTCVKYLFQETI